MNLPKTKKGESVAPKRRPRAQAAVLLRQRNQPSLIGLSGTELARAQVGTIRLRLLKIGAVVARNTWRIRLWLSSNFPLQELFCSCLERFAG